MKKRKAALLLCFVMALGCLTGCSDAKPNYQGTGRSISVNGYKSQMTTVNVRFYDELSNSIVKLPDGAYALPSGLNTCTPTLIDASDTPRVFRVNTPLSDLPSCFQVVLRGADSDRKLYDLYYKN
ncbi:MAG: hypothetical protein IK125_01915 [Lachnospiraceae bacterium]|nr:hypothetical protein [Lachnospiraceae bacterium]